MTQTEEAPRATYSSEEVARYYDGNTRSFLRFGQGGEAGAIRRAVWGPGVESRREAFELTNRLLLGELDHLLEHDRDRFVGRVLDLGCGAGGTLDYLLARRRVEGIGITNSGAQLAAAQRRLARRYEGRLSLFRDDFCRAPLAGPTVDLCSAVESFVHATDPSGFFRQVARVLRPGGRLVVCDDMRAAPAGTVAQRRLVAEIEHGWRMSSLLAPDEIDRLAAPVGLELVADRDLTPYLELDRPRDRMLALLRRLARLGPTIEHPRWLSLTGGAALRDGLRQGLITYRYRVWSRREPALPPRSDILDPSG